MMTDLKVLNVLSENLMSVFAINNITHKRCAAHDENKSPCSLKSPIFPRVNAVTPKVIAVIILSSPISPYLSREEYRLE